MSHGKWKWFLHMELKMLISRPSIRYIVLDYLGRPSVVMLLLLLISRFSRVRLCDPRDGSLPGSPVPGILQARTLEWVAISFSNAWKWKVKVKSLSLVWLFVITWTAAHQAPPSMGFSKQEYWSGVPLPSPSVVISALKCGRERQKSVLVSEWYNEKFAWLTISYFEDGRNLGDL